MDVYYAGTEAQWRAINIGSDNNSLLNADTHYDSVPLLNEDLFDSVKLLRYEVTAQSGNKTDAGR